MNMKKFISIPIFSVLSLMGFVYYITVFIFIKDWTGLLTSPGLINFFIFTSLASLCLFSFAVCVLTDPGSVPSSYLPDVEEISGSDHDAKNSALQMKQCEKCSTYKPPRAHHCRVCRRCVLRMDHHCLWINNCVGYWNYKSFFVLVSYGTLASLYSTFIIMSCAFQKNWNFEGTLPLKIFYVICAVMMISLSSTLGTLLGWHVYLIIRNMTTIEYYEGIRAAWLARKSGQSYQHPFDLSAYKNMTLNKVNLSRVLIFSGLRSKHSEMGMAYLSRPSKRWTQFPDFARYFMNGLNCADLVFVLVRRILQWRAY